MVHITSETVFNVNAECIVNPINVDGVIVKGVALEFALRYPQIMEEFNKEVENENMHIGKLYYYEIEGQKMINYPILSSVQSSNKYEWIEEGLKKFVEVYKDYNIKSIAFPLIGAHLPELDTDKLYRIMLRYLENLDLEIYICDGQKLGGKEAEMLKNLKNTDAYDFKNKVGIHADQLDIIMLYKNRLRRFYEITKLHQIGLETYKKIFNYFYNYEEVKETTLFDFEE
jgi:O-acetyl-ADP-ribose deacetylase (regulator of RNase III)